jgi:RHS repeat-associated protein
MIFLALIVHYEWDSIAESCCTGYAYDDENRKVTVTLPDGSETDARTANSMNEIVTRNGTTFTYDDIGNLLTDDKGHTLTWTADGLLATVENLDGSSTAMVYDGQRRLIKMVEMDSADVSTSSVQYLWNGWQLAQEVRTSGGVSETRTYVYGDYIDDVVAVKVTGGSSSGTYYYNRSLNFTTQVVTNAGGAIVEGYKNKPYGEYLVVLPGVDGKLGTSDDLEQDTSEIGNRNVFQGAPVALKDQSLVYLRNRWMSPKLGRFISRDPIGFNGGDFNLYRYVRNRPQTLVDPSGLKWNTWDFFNHYLAGSGNPVDLADVGLLGGFKALDGSRDLSRQIKNSINAGQTRGQKGTAVDAIDYVWSLGDVDSKGYWGCKKGECCQSSKKGTQLDCEISYAIEESFADPLDLHDIWKKIFDSPKRNEWQRFWNPEGEPYWITGEWKERFKTRCKSGQ